MAKTTFTWQGGAIALLGLATIAVLGACEAAPGLNKKLGTYYRSVQATLPETVEATRTGVPQANFQIISEQVDGDRARFVTQNPDDTEARITLERVADDRTRIGVKVRPGEAEGASRLLLRRIEAALP